MRIHLLVSEKMKPVPDDITIVEDYGQVDVVSPFSDMYHSGDHMVVEGDVEAMRLWLGPFNGVWIGEGPPMLQQFQIMHVTHP